MKTIIFATLIGGFVAFSALGQADVARPYRNFPIVATLQFHALSLPFRDLKSNLANVGFGLGTEVSLNGKHNWAQQVNLVWYRNRTVGNGVLLYTQTAWRPTLTGPLYAEVKAGAGYLVSFRPSEGYKQTDGNWMPVGHKSKGLFAIPAGISLGYYNPSSGTTISPFASYQFLLVTNYNKSIPLAPQTLLQVGSRIYLKN